MQKGTCLTIAERKTKRSATKQGFEKSAYAAKMKSAAKQRWNFSA